MHKGTIAIVFVILIALITAGGYFIYKSDPRVRLWIQSTFDVNLPNENILVNPIFLARDQERKEGVKVISDAIFQYTSEKKGLLPNDFPTQETCIGTAPPCYNLKALLVPVFTDEIPLDPKRGTQENTGFATYKNSAGRVVVKVHGESSGEFEIVR